MKRLKLLFIICAIGFKSKAQQNVFHFIKITRNGINSTEIIMNKLNNASYYNLFANDNGFGIYDSDLSKAPFNINRNGNVGIGTSNPENAEGWEKVLEVRGEGDAKSTVSTNSIVSGLWSHNLGFFGAPAGGFTGTYTNHPFSIITNQSAKLTVLPNGNVGLGTLNPSSKMHIYQPAADQAGLIVQGNTINADAAQHFVAITLDGDYGNQTGNYSQIRSYSNLYNNWGSKLAFYTSSSGQVNTLVERMIIDATGNIGIGTTAPQEKLAVNGNIRAREIKVETTNWPDYVFETDYKKLSLAELEKYIRLNKRLPEVPSADETEKNGIELGEMNKLLLKKIEELTLHLISQGKEIEALKAKVNKP